MVAKAARREASAPASQTTLSAKASVARTVFEFTGANHRKELRLHPEMLTLPPDYTFFIQLGTFLVLFLVLGQLLFAPFAEVLAEREARTTGDIAAAAASRAEVQSLLSQVDIELAKARASAHAEVETVRAQTREEATQLFQKAQGEAASRLAELRTEVAKATEDARAQLATDARTMAETMVTAVLGSPASR
jgi:F-type H+-transporting ATPase subunit b